MSKKELSDLVKKIEEYKSLGVTEHGKVGHKKLAEIMKETSVWAYPCTDPRETFCITAVKAQAAGCVPVVTLLGALEETVNPEAAWLKEIKTSEDVQTYKNLLLDVLSRIEKVERQKYIKFGKRFTWEKCVDKMLQLFFSVSQPRFVFTEKNTFCINVENATERRERMQKRLEQLKLECTFVKANTPETLTDKFLDCMRPGEKACAQSHFNLWRRILSEGLEWALVLEDDVRFDRQWRVKLNKFSEEEFDLILLNASEEVVRKNTWFPVLGQYYTGAYIISKKGAEKLIRKYQATLSPADWMTVELQRDGNSYCYFPWLAIQEGLETSIASNLQRMNKVVKNCLARARYSVENYLD